MRALTSASMDTPGPYEKVAKEAFFNVTLPEKNWTPAHIEEHLEMFNRGMITSTSIHEAYPGPLRAVPLGAERAVEGSQTAGGEFQRGRLGALLRADDDR